MKLTRFLLPVVAAGFFCAIHRFRPARAPIQFHYRPEVMNAIAQRDPDDLPLFLWKTERAARRRDAGSVVVITLEDLPQP